MSLPADTDTYRVLIVEDDVALAKMVGEYLTSHGYEVAIEGRGDAAVERIEADQPDAVVLDVNLPGQDGFEVCRAVRADYPGTIIMLTARGDEVDEVVGLELGADDYMAKPVRPRALLARLRTHLRKTPPDRPTPGQPIRVGDLLVDPSRRMVELGGAPLELSTAEFDLLQLLAEHAGQILSRKEIYLQIRGTQYDGLDRSIDLRISRLRKKLGDDPASPKRIKSVRGVGYMLSVEP